MTIKQLSETPIDKEKSMCVGFQLTVKRARSTRKVDGKTIQEVEWSDTTGEMPGDVLMPNPKQCSSLTRAAIINVVVCWLQPGVDGPKLYVEQWFFPKCDGDGNPIYRNGIRGYGDLPPDFCQEDEAVPSMCRNSVVREFVGGIAARDGCLPQCTELNKALINEWVEYILTGK